MPKPWQIVQSEQLIQTPYLNLRKDVCRLTDGTLLPDYYVVEEADYGMVFALTAAGEVVLVRQYKHGIGEVTLELPAGYFNASDSDPAAGCMREFREETGYDTAGFELIGSHIRHPTRNTNRGHLVAATGAHPSVEQDLDIAEDIEVLLLPVDEVFAHIRSGAIYAVGTVASVYFAWDYLTRTGQA
jgi:ADP-ribose pyrophosphatase